MDEAHKTCPYSKALRGDASVKLVPGRRGQPEDWGEYFCRHVGGEQQRKHSRLL